MVDLNFYKNKPEKPEPKFDAKDIRKSFGNIATALKGLKTDLNSAISKSIKPLFKKIDAIEGALPNKSDILNEFKTEISESEGRILASHKDQLAERLSPEKLKIAISDIVADTQKQKDNKIRLLEDEAANISQLRESKASLEKEKKQLIDQCDTFDEQKKNLSVRSLI